MQWISRFDSPNTAFLALLGGDASTGGIELEGDSTVLSQLLSVIDPGDDAFAIVTP